MYNRSITAITRDVTITFFHHVYFSYYIHTCILFIILLSKKSTEFLFPVEMALGSCCVALRSEP